MQHKLQKSVSVGIYGYGCLLTLDYCLWILQLGLKPQF